MRRTNEKAQQMAGKPPVSSGNTSKLWHLAALVLLAVIEAQGQNKQGRATQGNATSAASDRRIVVSIPDRKLALIESGRMVKVYSVAVGAEVSPSPFGEFRVRERIFQPTYYAPGKVIPPGKSNPLGTRWIGLGHRGYGIHGTNEPRSIGKNASHGCFRMRNRDVEELFERVRAGDRVEIYRERTEEVAQLFGITPERPATPVAQSAPGVVAAGGL